MSRYKTPDEVAFEIEQSIIKDQERQTQQLKNIHFACAVECGVCTTVKTRMLENKLTMLKVLKRVWFWDESLECWVCRDCWKLLQKVEKEKEND